MADHETSKELFQKYLQDAETTPFSGWNFEHLTETHRMIEAPLGWNYYNVIFPWLSASETMLDMGTGGGEVLSRFKPLPAYTYATESYRPNISVAKKRLEPLGVKVIELREEKHPPFNRNLPFDDDVFDLTINRHEGYSPSELLRILKSGKKFITQQVGSLTVLNLRQSLLNTAIEKIANWNLQSAVSELESAGFEIPYQQEEISYMRFYDIGAIAYYLKAIPWIIDGFTVKKYKDQLWKLHDHIHRDGYYDIINHKFVIIAEKP